MTLCGAQDPNDEGVHDAMIRLSLHQDLNSVLTRLTPREAGVLRMRYGLDRKQAATLEEVGQRFDLSRERIRQIELRAVAKLRNWGEIQDELNDYGTYDDVVLTRASSSIGKKAS